MAKRKYTISFFSWLCCNATFSFFFHLLVCLFCFVLYFSHYQQYFFRIQSNHFTFQIPRGCCQTIFVVSLKTKDSLVSPLNISHAARLTLSFCFRLASLDVPGLWVRRWWDQGRWSRRTLCTAQRSNNQWHGESSKCNKCPKAES